MRFVMLLIVVFLGFGCSFEKELPPSPGKNVSDNTPCAFFKTYTLEERLQREPFNQAKRIDLISLDRIKERLRYIGDTLPDQLPGNALFSNFLGYKKEFLWFERVTLSRSQIDSLTNILFNFDYGRAKNGEIDKWASLCHNPRQAILLYREIEDAEMFASIEICLECHSYWSRPDKYDLGNFCEGKYDLLRAFFRQTGITYGLDN
jgi:hypothetical protein